MNLMASCKSEFSFRSIGLLQALTSGAGERRHPSTSLTASAGWCVVLVMHANAFRFGVKCWNGKTIVVECPWVKSLKIHLESR